MREEKRDAAWLSASCTEKKRVRISVSRHATNSAARTSSAKTRIWRCTTGLSITSMITSIC
ncbi:MAG: hypothetical protein R2856_25460 [Caldilineaceae bacterium]